MNWIPNIFVSGLIAALITCSGFLNIANGQERIIFDTDFDSDIDDVGALYLLHTLADRGEAEILATVLSTTHFWSPFALDAVNTFWNRPDIPIGIPLFEGVNKGSYYAETIAREFPNDVGEKKELESATSLYRRILSSQPDGSVTLVSVGHLSNVAKLLESTPDDLSSLDGKELVAKKVKWWVAMLGEGMNWNMRWDRIASEIAINECPVPIVFTTEGADVKTGRLTQNLPDENPIKNVYRIWEKHYDEIDRSSWDQITTWFAIIGQGRYFRTEAGTLSFSPEHGAQWQPEAHGEDFRLFNTLSNEKMADAIEELMIEAPRSKLRGIFD